MSFKPKILVVEDDPQALRMLDDMLTRMGAEPRSLESSQRAAELINREKFDAFFLDLTMPGLSGLELAEHIRWSKSNSRCPIVMITGTAEAAMVSKCFRAGVNFFLQKPVGMQQLETLLNATRGLMAQERRRYQRVPVQVSVLCQWVAQSLTQSERADSINLSASGILLNLGTTPPPGGAIQLKFNLPGEFLPFDVTGRVVRVGPKQQVSLTFVALTAEQRQRLMDFTDRALAAGSKTPLPSAAR